MKKQSGSLYHRFKPGVERPSNNADQALFFAFKDEELLLRETGNGYIVPTAASPQSAGLSYQCEHYLGLLDAQQCYALELEYSTPAPETCIFMPLRQVYLSIPEIEFLLAGRAHQIIEWERTHQFCGRCGMKPQSLKNERAKKCPTCGLINYPRLSPAIIVLVQRGNQLLLCRSPHFREGMHSVLAGFVEPGETLEEAVQREVEEEVGIQVQEIKYFGSQPWPFPNSLMIGFTAEYAGGKINVRKDEIEEADWYSVDSLPKIPGKISIARNLIDYFIDKQSRVSNL